MKHVPKQIRIKIYAITLAAEHLRTTGTIIPTSIFANQLTNNPEIYRAAYRDKQFNLKAAITCSHLNITTF